MTPVKRAAAKVKPTQYEHLTPQVVQAKAKTLQSYLQQLGEVKHGTRAANLQRLQNALRRPRWSAQRAGRPTRILSVDMGIKNLAFCVLDVDGSGLDVGSDDARRAHYRMSRGRTDEGGHVHSLIESPQALGCVRVVAWKRLSLLGALSASSDAADQTAVADEPDEDVVADAILGSAKEGQADYSPFNVVGLAYKLVKDVFLPYKITHVLIERQRYRSGGGSAIQEWTIRVNMLESMFIAIFETLKQQGKSLPPSDRDETMPSVHAVNPTQVNALWLESGNEDPTKKSEAIKRKKRTSMATKESKIDIAAAWAQHTLSFANAATRSRDRFLLGMKRRTRADSGKSKARQGQQDSLEGQVNDEPLLPVDKKLDDLADCLLQGVAWVQWELNRRSFAQTMLLEPVPNEDVTDKTEQQDLDISSLEAWPRIAPVEGTGWVLSDGPADSKRDAKPTRKSRKPEKAATMKRVPKTSRIMTIADDFTT